MKAQELKKVNGLTQTKVTDKSWLEIADVLDANGLEYIDVPGGRATGDGITNMSHTVVCGDKDKNGNVRGDIVEIWNNADRKRAYGVAIRPTVGMLKGAYAIPVKALESVDGIKLQGVSKHSITQARIVCNTDEAVAIALAVIMEKVHAYNKAWTKKQETTKKTTAKKDVKAS